MNLEDRETMRRVMTEVMASFLGKPVLETKTEPVVEQVVFSSTPIPVSHTDVAALFKTVSNYRAALKKYDKVMNQYRDAPFDSKIAKRNILTAKKNLEEAEEGFLTFCKKVANGTMVINRGT